MTISERSIFEEFLPASTPSAVGSRAKMPRSPMYLELERMEAARGYSLKWSWPLAIWMSNTSSWKMFQNSLIEGSDKFSDRWPRSGSMRNGTVFQHAMSGITMSATGYLSLPTPAARDGKDLSRTEAYLSQRERHSPSMCTILLLGGTPWFHVSYHYEREMGFPSQWSAAVYP